MTVQTYEIISYVAYALAAVSFIVAVLLFVFYNIPKVIGSISGSTAKKAIEDIRKQNEESGDKAFKPSHVNASRGKLTDKISNSGRLVKQVTSPLGVSVGTNKLNTQETNETTVLDDSQVYMETAVLIKNDETALLANTYMDSANETTILNTPQINGIVVDADITFIHTDEVIE